jgi:hypothetical protein
VAARRPRSRASREGLGWRSRRFRVRRQSSTSSSPVDVSVNAYSQRTVALLLLCEFVLLATATYFIIPFFAPAVSSGATQTADDGNMLVGAAVGLVVCAVRRAAATRHPLWLVASYCVVAINMVALPAILVVGLRLPASLGMPPLLMAFWVSLTAAIFLITRQLNLIEPKSVGAIIFGGGIGLAGFALFATQIGVVAQGYTSIVPVRSQTGTVDLPMALIGPPLAVQRLCDS